MLEGFNNAFVYVDESNLCIQGGKEWAKKHPELPNLHLKWLYDLSILAKCIGDGFEPINDDFHMAFFFATAQIYSPSASKFELACPTAWKI